MGKQKTKKLITNRVRVTKSGKVMRRRAFKRHLAVGKSKKRLARLSRTVQLKGSLAKRVKKYLGK